MNRAFSVGFFLHPRDLGPCSPGLTRRRALVTLPPRARQRLERRTLSYPLEDYMTYSVPDRLYLGMVGGGRGAFIGETHRVAARLDDRYELGPGAPNSHSPSASQSGSA